MMTILSDSLHLYPEDAPLAVTILNVWGKGPLGEYGLYNVLWVLLNQLRVSTPQYVPFIFFWF